MTIEVLLGDVNEDSTAYATVSFKDKDGSPETPATISYRVDCVTTGTAIRASTPLSTGATVEITLTPADNAIVSASNEYEIRELTVSATFGAGLESHASARWRVLNLTYKT